MLGPTAPGPAASEPNNSRSPRFAQPDAERGHVRQTAAGHMNGDRHIELFGQREIGLERGIVGPETRVRKAQLPQRDDGAPLHQLAYLLDRDARVAERQRRDEPCIACGPVLGAWKRERAEDHRDHVVSIELGHHRIGRSPHGMHVDVDDRRALAGGWRAHAGRLLRSCRMRRDKDRDSQRHRNATRHARHLTEGERVNWRCARA